MDVSFTQRCAGDKVQKLFQLHLLSSRPTQRLDTAGDRITRTPDQNSGVLPIHGEKFREQAGQVTVDGNIVQGGSITCRV